VPDHSRGNDLAPILLDVQTNWKFEKYSSMLEKLIVKKKTRTSKLLLVRVFQIMP